MLQHTRGSIEPQYLELLRDLLSIHSNKKSDRTGTGTHSLFGYTLRHNMFNGFPLLTTKTVWLKGIFEELMWFLRGETDVRILQQKNVHIWDDDFYKHYLKTATDPVAQKDFDYDIPNTPIYGHQWRNLNVDQIKDVINQIQTNPDSRRIIINNWNVEQINQMVLPPCHVLSQFYTRNGTEFENCADKKVLSLLFYQRSADTFLGLPYNIASYALLLELMASHCDMVAGDLVVMLGDVHLYNNHIEAAETQIKRIPNLCPKIKILNKKSNIWDYKYEDIELIDYKSQGVIKATLNT
jgi:thymidylate synthase